MPVTLPGLMNASTQKFAVPNPKSSLVGTFTLSSVPSNNIDDVPNFFCAVSNCESPNLLKVLGDLFTVTNSPVPFPVMNTYVPSLLETTPRPTAFL